MRVINNGGDSSSSSLPSSSFRSFQILQNYPLISALVAFSTAQLIKFFTTWYKEKRWDPKQLIGSGGMPSSHAATVTALAIGVGFQEGFSGSVFATAIILACIVMYDAFGVRLHAGRQAEVLNQIVYELPAEHPLADSRPLRELLGHTPTQIISNSSEGEARSLFEGVHKIRVVIAGAILGSVTATMAHVISRP